MNEMERTRAALEGVRGPWHETPDRIYWIDKKSGLPCLIRKTFHGILCGYVGVAPGQTGYRQSYDELGMVNVHGGLTYAGWHIPYRHWWFGFDCAHNLDFNPGLYAITRKLGLTSDAFNDRAWEWRGVAYVKGQCTLLAEQLLAIQSDVLALDDDESASG